MEDECPHGLVGDGSCPECSLKEPLERTPVLPVFVGLDMSLSSTGFCRKQGTNITIDTIKTTPKTAENDLARLQYIVHQVMERIPMAVEMICMEDYFTPGNKAQLGAAIKLVALGTVMRMELYKAGYPFYIVAPSILKKYCTGKGTGQKSIVVREVYKKWGIDAKDDNQADACVLAHMSEGFVMEPELKYQQEIIKRLREGDVGKSYNVT